MSPTGAPTLLVVPGLRDEAPGHWQSLLLAARPDAIGVPPMGRENLSLAMRVDAIERAANAIVGPLVIVAHSAGTLAVAHWARHTTRLVRGALLAVPPDFETPMPDGYPTLDALAAEGWLPVPRVPLPFRTLVAASRNDPLARFTRVATLAVDWDAELVDLGEVAHLNPASGHGPWPMAETLIGRLSAP